MQEMEHMLVKDVMVVKCMMVSHMLQFQELLLDQNINTLELIKHAKLHQLKLDILSMVMLKLNHKVHLHMLKLLQNMHFLLELMLVELTFNYIKVEFIAKLVMELLKNLIMVLQMLDMEQIIILLKTHGDHHGENQDISDLLEFLMLKDNVVFNKKLLIHFIKLIVLLNDFLNYLFYLI